MQGSHELIPSAAMGRSMHLWKYGHWGAPLLVFPSAAGFAHEWDANGMVDTLGDLVAGGKLKIYCTESNVAEAWTRREQHPAFRVTRHQAYERFIVSELVPYIRQDCGGADLRIATAGCSLGAFYAANFTLKFPELFHWALCMSGRYDVRNFTGGYTNTDIYFNNPLAFVPNLEGEHLERVRRQAHLVLVCGQGAWEEGCIDETQALANLLSAKQISHQRDIWGHDVSHDWAWWKRQSRHHLTQALTAW